MLRTRLLLYVHAANQRCLVIARSSEASCSAFALLGLQLPPFYFSQSRHLSANSEHTLNPLTSSW